MGSERPPGYGVIAVWISILAAIIFAWTTAHIVAAGGGGIAEWINKFQTLIGAIVAVGAAWYAGGKVSKQIEVAQHQLYVDREDKLRARAAELGRFDFDCNQILYATMRFVAAPRRALQGIPMEQGATVDDVLIQLRDLAREFHAKHDHPEGQKSMRVATLRMGDLVRRGVKLADEIRNGAYPPIAAEVLIEDLEQDAGKMHAGFITALDVIRDAQNDIARRLDEIERAAEGWKF